MSRFQSCPICDGGNLIERNETQAFEYGAEAPVTLSVVVPAVTCAGCGLTFFDERAEVLRHEAVCAHLQVLNAAQIKSLRKDIYGMSRKKFAEKFGFSEASLDRWENRRLIQNEQTDKYMRILAHKSVRDIVMGLHEPVNSPLNNIVDMDSYRERKFRSLDSSKETQLRARAMRFRLMGASG